jgi:flagellar assembly protein FliH
MSAPAKFLFDTDFARGERRAVATVTLAEHQAALAEAEARGYRTGLAAGQAEVAGQTERQLAAALSGAAAGLEALGGGLQAIESRMQAEAVQLALAVARKLAPALISVQPFAEIAALATECFTHLVGAPHVVVRVNEALYDTARERLEEIARSRGLEARLVVLAEPDIALGDCRIEWADGGVVRDRAATQSAITEAVIRYVAARTLRSSEPRHE